MARITALTEHPSSRVAVELEGRHWRVLPTAAVVRVGLAIGRELDRGTARELARELRRLRAVEIAARALRHGDLPREKLSDRLEASGVRERDRDAALRRLEQLGLVDDERFAAERAALLARRGWGDAGIAADLERAGVRPEVCRQALESLESERARAERLVAEEGATPRLGRRLVARGFGEEAVALAFGAAFAPDP